MRTPRPITRVTLILLVVILLPALFFSAYQISTLSESERLLSDLYQRQLESVVYSVNQYALDVAHSWVSSAIQVIPTRKAPLTDREKEQVQAWCRRAPSSTALVITDSTLRRAVVIASPEARIRPPGETEVLASLRANRDKVDKLPEYRQLGYRKLEPFDLTADGKPSGEILLVFAVGDQPSDVVGGLILDESVFIREILSRKLQDVAGEDFILGVLKNNEIAISTSEVRPGDLKQQKQIWVLPGYALGIRPRGTTIEELVGSRVTKNIGLVILLDVLLAVGIALLYRNVRREMDLARIKSDFVSNVSHELRTPLALIRMYAETLEMGRLKDNQKKAEYLTTILRESERLTRLVNNILDFSKMQAGKKQYTFAPVQVNELVRRVLATYSVQLQAREFVPIVELDPELPPVHADAEAVSEALINIIDNAVKYSDAAHDLAVRTGRSGTRVFVSVEDHGIGISPSDQGKIFDMFYRVSTGHVHERRGTGIGLALVKHIMDAHGGTVGVTSTLGKGSTFRLEFPLTQS